MLDHMNRKQQLDIRACMRNLLVYGSCLPVATALGFAILAAGMAALVGLPAVDAGLDFFGEAAVALAEPAANLWLTGFFAASFCFGVGRGLPGLLQHRSLNIGALPRFTQAIALQAPPDANIAALLRGPISGLPLLARPSRTALSTPSDLAGPAPRLE